MNAWSFKEKYHQKIRRKLSKKLSFPVPKYESSENTGCKSQKHTYFQIKTLLHYAMTLLQGPKDPVLPTPMYISQDFLKSYLAVSNGYYFFMQ